MTCSGLAVKPEYLWKYRVLRFACRGLQPVRAKGWIGVTDGEQASGKDSNRISQCFIFHRGQSETQGQVGLLEFLFFFFSFFLSDPPPKKKSSSKLKQLLSG